MNIWFLFTFVYAIHGGDAAAIGQVMARNGVPARFDTLLDCQVAAKRFEAEAIDKQPHSIQRAMTDCMEVPP